MAARKAKKTREHRTSDRRQAKARMVLASEIAAHHHTSLRASDYVDVARKGDIFVDNDGRADIRILQVLSVYRGKAKCKSTTLYGLEQQETRIDAKRLARSRTYRRAGPVNLKQARTKGIL